MTDQTLETSDIKDDKETGDPSSATPKEVKSEATPNKESVTLAKEDYQKLISQRDKNFEDNRTASERLDAIEAEKARDNFIKEFLGSAGEDYSYVEADDLLNATSPEEVEALAKRVQARGQAIEEKALSKIKVNDSPPVASQDQVDKIDKLKKRALEGDSSAFDEWIDSTVLA